MAIFGSEVNPPINPSTVAASLIAKQAFRLLGLAPLSSFDEAHEHAQAASEQLPIAIGAVLELTDFSFARKIVELSEATDETTDPDYPHAYALPSDFRRMIRVIDDCIVWRLDGRFIRADQGGGIRIRYSIRQPSELNMTALFIEAAAARLAADLAPRIAKSARMAAQLEEMADFKARKAIMQDAQSASPERHDGQERKPFWSEAALR